MTTQNLARLILGMVALLLAASVESSSQTTEKTANASGARVPVVLELFTSEGCSSCPPADALLAKLAEQQPVAGAEIIAIEEHVDYWDQQGWVDPFSSSQWTERQKVYAAGFADHGVYTPELIVNGGGGLVGSHEGDTFRAIASAAAKPRTEISVSVLPTEKRGHERLRVEVGKIAGAQSGDTAEIWLAITESALHSAVSGGENAGHELHHAPVLRWLHKAGTANGASAFSGDSDVKLDSGWKRKNLRAVAFLQEKRSRRILGAAAIAFEP